MEDYYEFINERIKNMTLIVESSVALETRNKKQENDAVRSFLRFFKKKDPKKAKEYEKDHNKIKKDANKNKSNFVEWVLTHPALATTLFGYQYVQAVQSANKKNE